MSDAAAKKTQSIPQTLAEALLTIPVIPQPILGENFLGIPENLLGGAAPTAENGSGEAKNESDSDEDDSDDEEKTEDAPDGADVSSDSQKTPRRRLNYTLEFKKAVIQFAEKHNNCQAAAKFNVPRQCIQRWRQIKPELEEQMNGTPYSSKKKRLGGGGRPLKNVELDEKLEEWLKEKITERGTKITGKMIKEHAISICGNDTFKASNGWLQRFMIRHGLASPPTPKESTSSAADWDPLVIEMLSRVAQSDEWEKEVAKQSKHESREERRRKRKEAKEAAELEPRVVKKQPPRKKAKKEGDTGTATAGMPSGMEGQIATIERFVRDIQDSGEEVHVDVAAILACLNQAEPTAEGAEPEEAEPKEEEPEEEEPVEEEAEPKEAEPAEGAEVEEKEEPKEAEPVEEGDEEAEDSEPEVVRKVVEPESTSSDSETSSDDDD